MNIFFYDAACEQERTCRKKTKISVNTPQRASLIWINICYNMEKNRTAVARQLKYESRDASQKNPKYHPFRNNFQTCVRFTLFGSFKNFVVFWYCIFSQQFEAAVEPLACFSWCGGEQPADGVTDRCWRLLPAVRLAVRARSGGQSRV